MESYVRDLLNTHLSEWIQEIPESNLEVSSHLESIINLTFYTIIIDGFPQWIDQTRQLGKLQIYF